MDRMARNGDPRFGPMEMGLCGDWINQLTVLPGPGILWDGSHRRGVHLLCLGTLTAGTTACSGPLSSLDAAGPAARDIASLWWAMLAGATVLTLLVVMLLTLALLRARREDIERPQKDGSTAVSIWLGALGIAMPIVVLIALLGYALVLGERAVPRPTPGLVVVEAIGRQWTWEFSQPGADGPIVTREEMHIPAGRPVEVRIVALDVIHGFWVPRLAGKIDAIPGHVNVLRLQAALPGVFEGQCAEFCGSGHSAHRFRVIAHDEASWATFQRGGMP
jgi:cytochrome c oxidase subunit II